MEENSETQEDLVSDSQDIQNKKKNRRGKRGSGKGPKQTAEDADVNGSPVNDLTDAIRQLALSQVELLEKANGPAVASTSSGIEAKTTTKKKKTVSELILESAGKAQTEAENPMWNVLQLQIQQIEQANSSIIQSVNSSKTMPTILTEKPVIVSKPDMAKQEKNSANLDSEENITPKSKRKHKKKPKSETLNASVNSTPGEQVKPKAGHEKPSSGVNSETASESSLVEDSAVQVKKKKTKRGGRGKGAKSKNQDNSVDNAAGTSSVKVSTAERISAAGVLPLSTLPVPEKTPKKQSGFQNKTPQSQKSVHSTPNSEGRNQNRSPRRSRGYGNKQDDNSFPQHWTAEKVEEGVISGNVVKGAIRINKKNFREAYINSPNGGMDILLEGIRARNRALEGDEVAVLILPLELWKEQRNGVKQKTGQVISILKQEHHRQAVGTLKPLQEPDSVWALFSPRDSRIPRIRIIAATCPSNYTSVPEQLYLAEIKTWDDQRHALGTLVSIVGMAGSIEAETKRILMENGLDVEPYGPEMSQYYPSLPYKIPKEEIKQREDFRKLCIFTIDPATARDLDDAVSYQELPNGEKEVGVHISDVAHFLKEGTPLDEIVSSRATTTYLIQSVYHMLPVDLCRLCSLTPGEDKLAFSVLWRVNKKGEFQEPRFTRSVLLSCCQMAYEQAQAIMDAPADKEWTQDDLPQLHGGFTPRQVVDTVLGLQPLARTLRAGRFDAGALRIDQPKLSFGLDPETGLPDRFSVYQNMECHRLIEELMLLANMAVAKQLRENVPDLALLRCHPPPHDHMLPELQKVLEQNGVHLNIDSSKAMHESLQQYLNHTDPVEIARGWALSSLLSKPMARARYFCAKGTDEDEQWHFALSVPLYTHFTSPIRRYADVVVHRLLAATLNYTPCPEWHPDFVSKLASNCNGKKYSAKRAGEQSGELYLALYVGVKGPLIEDAVVVDIKDHSFDVLVLQTGSTHRVYTNNMNGKDATAVHESIGKNVFQAKISWNQHGLQVIKLFSLVTVKLTKAEKELRVQATLCPPTTSSTTS